MISSPVESGDPIVNVDSVEGFENFRNVRLVLKVVGKFLEGIVNALVEE